MFMLFASTSIRLINPIYLSIQSVKHLISVLFFRGLTSETFIHKKRWSTQILVKEALHFVNFYTIKLIKIIIITFWKTFAIIDAPLFIYNVLLVFNFLHNLHFLRRGLTAILVCFSATHTSCDAIQRAKTLIKK